MNSLTAGSALMIICGLPPSLSDGQRRLSVFGPDTPTSFIPTFRRIFIHQPGHSRVQSRINVPGTSFARFPGTGYLLPDRGIDPIGARPAPSRRLADTAHRRAWTRLFRRVVPNVKTEAFEENRDFYRAFLGIKIGMSMGLVVLRPLLPA